MTDEDASKWKDAWARRREYEEYCESMRAALRESAAAGTPEQQALWRGVELIFLPEHGHLVGTVRAAFERVDSPGALVLQHDLVLDSEAVAQALPAVRWALRSGRAHYVCLNRDAHYAVRPMTYWTFEPEADLVFPERAESASAGAPAASRATHRTALTAVTGFSDQAHFVGVPWYREHVLGRIPAGRRTCMEHVVHSQMVDARADGGAHAKTYLLGGMRDKPILLDLVHGQVTADDHWSARPHDDSEWAKFYASPSAAHSCRVRVPEGLGPGDQFAARLGGADGGQTITLQVPRDWQHGAELAAQLPCRAEEDNGVILRQMRASLLGPDS